MRHACIGIGTVICLFTAACSDQPLSPASQSGVADVRAQMQVSGGDPIEVTFTKWGTAPGVLAGVTGGAVPGTFAGTVLSRDPFDNGTIVQLEAQYGVTATDGVHSFVAHIEGKQNNQTLQAVFNGTVIDGWLVGAQVQVTYDVIPAQAGISCVPQAPVNRNCFQGTIRILPGSAAASLPRSGDLHVTKECSTYAGRAGDVCTITSSNVAEIEVGSRIVYAQAADFSTLSLDSDVVLDLPGPGDNTAFGHCQVNLATETGLCTFSGGTGKFTHFRASANVSYLGGPNYAWDGTYAFDPRD